MSKQCQENKFIFMPIILLRKKGEEAFTHHLEQ